MFDLISSSLSLLCLVKHTYFGCTCDDEVTHSIHQEKKKKEIIAFVSITKRPRSESLRGVLVHSPKRSAFRESRHCAVIIT